VDLSVVMVTWNSRECVGACLDSIGEAVGELATEVIVVDNLSSDSTVAFIRENHPQVKLIENRENVGFGRGAQMGVGASGGEFVAILNPDVSLPPGSLRRLVALLQDRPAACWTGPKVVLSSGRIQSGPFKLGTAFEPLRSFPGVFRLLASLGGNKHDRPRWCEKLDGACMVFRAEMLRTAGGIPTSTFMYGEEQLLGARFLRLGYEVWYDPNVVIFHDLGSSSRQKWTSDDTRLARQAGHTAAMRETLGPARFLLYNLLLLLSLVLKAGGGLAGHGPRPSLTGRMIKLCLSDFRPRGKPST
jgi:N-acetylglucosaminyl-diphospho-decaprenol L-rhamnosyltransferase